MKRPLGDIFSELARFASDRHQPILAYLMRMAALEARQKDALATFDAGEIGPRELIVGLWDWDVPGNLRHLDSRGACLFGYEQRGGFTEQQLTDRIHPDDVAEWRRKVFTAAATGGIYEHEYRVIHDDRLLWIRARGQCTLDKSGRPERFPGAMIDVTRLRAGGSRAS